MSHTFTILLQHIRESECVKSFGICIYILVVVHRCRRDYYRGTDRNVGAIGEGKTLECFASHDYYDYQIYKANLVMPRGGKDRTYLQRVH